MIHTIWAQIFASLHYLLFILAVVGAVLWPTAAAAQNELPGRRLLHPLNAFELQLHRQLAASITPNQNMVICDFCVLTALAMARNGAAGKTAQELDNVLRINEHTAKLNSTLRASLRIYEPRTASKNYSSELRQSFQAFAPEPRIITAQSIWADSQLSITPAFLETIRHSYLSDIKQLYFGHSTEAAERINEWVRNLTNKKIPQLVSSDMFGSATKLVLTTGAYFQAQWEFPFPEEATKDEEFNQLTGVKTIVPFMHWEGKLALYQDDEQQQLLLPYRSQDKSLAMIVLLPRKTADLPRIEQELSLSTISSRLSQSKPYTVSLSLPKFRFDTSVPLKKALFELGVKEAFGDEANFSQLSPSQHISIDQIWHKALIDVNERGTEAAGATAAIFYAAINETAGPVSFRADRPFLFFIVDFRTRMILFSGRVLLPEISAVSPEVSSSNSSSLPDRETLFQALEAGHSREGNIALDYLKKHPRELQELVPDFVLRLNSTKDQRALRSLLYAIEFLNIASPELTQSLIRLIGEFPDLADKAMRTFRLKDSAHWWAKLEDAYRTGGPKQRLGIARLISWQPNTVYHLDEWPRLIMLMLREPNPEVRFHGASVVPRQGCLREAAYSLLKLAYEDENLRVRKQAARMIHNLGGLVCRLEDITPALSDSSPDIRWDALEALSQGRFRPEQSVTVAVCPLLDDKNKEIQHKALTLISAASGKKELCSCLAGSKSLFGLLDEMGQEDNQPSAPLIDYLGSRECVERPEGAALFEKLLRSKNPNVAETALNALRRLEQLAQGQFVDAVVLQLESSSAKVRQAAMHVIERTAMNTTFDRNKQLSPLLLSSVTGALKDEDPIVREYAIKTIAWSSSFPSYIPQIAPLLKDSEPSVWTVAATSLCNKGGEKAQKALELAIPSIRRYIREASSIDESCWILKHILDGCPTSKRWISDFPAGFEEESMLCRQALSRGTGR